MNATEPPFDATAIAIELKRIATMDPKSLPARVEPHKFDEVVELVAQYINPECADLEVAVIAALGRVRDNFPDGFRKKKIRAMRY